MAKEKFPSLWLQKGKEKREVGWKWEYDEGKAWELTDQVVDIPRK